MWEVCRKEGAEERSRMRMMTKRMIVRRRMKKRRRMVCVIVGDHSKMEECLWKEW